MQHCSTNLLVLSQLDGCLCRCHQASSFCLLTVGCVARVQVWDACFQC